MSTATDRPNVPEDSAGTNVAPAAATGLRGAHVHHHLRGGHGRLRHRLLIFFAIAFAAILGFGALGAVIGAPSQHLCKPYRPCGPPKVVRPLVNQTVWRSSQYGFTLEYPASAVSISQQDGGSLTLQADLGGGSTGTILIQGSPGNSVAPAQAISRQIANLTGVTQLAADTAPADQLHGSGVGYLSGPGKVYIGYFSAPQGVGDQVALASEAATNGRVTVSVTVGGAASQAGSSSFLYALADRIINSVHWPSGT